jgi:CheY-like chemotaxis protein
MDKKHIVLLVEDRQDDVLLIAKAFAQAELWNEVKVVENGEEAMFYLSGQGKYADREKFPLPDLMLLDLKMPRVDGFEVLEWLRTQPALSGLKVVVLTGSDQIRDVNRAYQLGATSFMVKPTDFKDIKALSTTLKDYWRSGTKAPGLRHPTS